MTAIFSYLISMLPFALLPLPFVGLIRWRENRKILQAGGVTQWPHEIGILLFSAYLGGLLSATILPSFSFENGVLVFHQGTGGGVHLIPFGIFQDSWRLWQQGNITYGLINLAGNIAVFVPMGFFLSLLWRRPSFWKALAGGFLLSLSIELIQLLLPDRWTDVDDLWMNTLGAGCGYWIFLLIPSRFHPRFWSPFSGKQDR